ncbi:MAG: EAL domain-containing protein [Eubacterium sp.]|nr:EAL domain-containing protein [Eubacterium sp.]
MDEIYLGVKAGGFRPESRAQDIRSACDHARYACECIKSNYDESYREYDHSMDEGVEKKHYIINHVRDAVTHGYVKAYYQPVVWADDCTVCGAEALARWIDPKYGFLSPGDFITALEDARQIHILDRGIIEIVFRDLRERINSGEPVLPVSVNFSRLDFELYDVAGYLKEMVEKYEVDPKFIHVEVTESALTVHFEGLRKTLEELKEIGFTVWLDDFGSGYSSLNVLKDFEFNVVKIDMNFLSNFNSNHKTKPILNSVVNMAEQIEMRTLTEGVETEEESAFLKEIGCERLQGYLFGKPMPKEELYEKIRVGELILSDRIPGLSDSE